MTKSDDPMPEPQRAQRRIENILEEERITVIWNVLGNFDLKQNWRRKMSPANVKSHLLASSTRFPQSPIILLLFRCLYLRILLCFVYLRIIMIHPKKRKLEWPKIESQRSRRRTSLKWKENKCHFMISLFDVAFSCHWIDDCQTHHQLFSLSFWFRLFVHDLCLVDQALVSDCFWDTSHWQWSKNDSGFHFEMPINWVIAAQWDIWKLALAWVCCRVGKFLDSESMNF